uniref:Putative ovule protein n=1 Tax=Solanum chacoense TaxID=4108 RepID=A0A0V0IRI3_SOLCH
MQIRQTTNFNIKNKYDVFAKQQEQFTLRFQDEQSLLELGSPIREVDHRGTNKKGDHTVIMYVINNTARKQIPTCHITLEGQQFRFSIMRNANLAVLLTIKRRTHKTDILMVLKALRISKEV